MTSQKIRQQFLDFFKQKAHKIVPSSPMVLKNDPTLMFTNAGMVPFKEYFLGQKKVTDNRVADTQKCLRVSGKHNDLEEVGLDTYHHTMFEMLGNWSFGDPADASKGYFKEEAIAWGWELLTKVYGIDKNNLYVTVFEGDAADHLDFDQEAFDFWKAWIDEDRIINGNKKDNFWEMGAQGPCGPCSEIHIDLRSDAEKAKVPGKSLVNQDHPLVVEIWNLVFMQYNRKADGSLEELAAKHIDTGMGFERLCMALQGVQSNYDTDIFKPLIREVETICNVNYEAGTEGSDKLDIAVRVIVDHVRAVVFAIADGQLPSNTGAGYVIRRILRRAIRYGFTFLNQDQPFIFRLTRILSDQMGDVFPELRSQESLIKNVIKEEEHSFLNTLEQGLLLLDKVIQDNHDSVINGAKAFELYDTYGFPLDLTQLIASERGLSVDEKGFDQAMQKQKDRSRAASAMETSDWVVLEEDEQEEFVGYDILEVKVKLTRYRKITSKKDGELYQLVFNMTPFYPEGGGQVGDKGHIEMANGDVVYILDTKKENNLIVHYAKNLPSHPREMFTAVVNKEQRHLSASNHTATHLLHQALRAILGPHIEQKGSLVSPKHLRFDFSHFAKLSPTELQEIEEFVNARIRENLRLEEQRSIPLQKALDEGAIALFGEKYGDSVRSIRFGNSMELCGGIHVQQTSDIWYFKIKSESAVAAGIRRIEAITNAAVGDYFVQIDRAFTDMKEALKNPKNPLAALTSLQTENQRLKKEVEALLKVKAAGLKTELKGKITDINGINFLACEVNLDPNSLKDLAYQLGSEIKNLYFVAATTANEKALLTVYIDKNITTDRLHAGTIVRELGKYIKGGGGGQAFFATAGGKDPAGIKAALAAAADFID